MKRLIYVLFSIYLGINAHGDHSDGAHLDEEKLVYYDPVSTDSFVDLGDGRISGAIIYKNRYLRTID